MRSSPIRTACTWTAPLAAAGTRGASSGGCRRTGASSRSTVTRRDRRRRDDRRSAPERVPRLLRARMAEELAALGITEVHGVLLDLGVSPRRSTIPGVASASRFDGPLDMRMDPTRGESAAQFSPAPTSGRSRR